MKNYKNAFTMIELIFVVIILGVLAAVAVPKFTNAKTSAELASGKSDIAAIRSAIMTERQSSLVKGEQDYITKLTPTTASTMLFTGDGGVSGNPERRLLNPGIRKGTGAGDWNIISNTTYTFNSGNDTTTFTYEDANGTFTCVVGANECDRLAD